MNKLKEKDFQHLREITYGRLDPIAINKFLWATFICSLIAFFVFNYGHSTLDRYEGLDRINFSLWESIKNIYIVLLMFNFLCAVIFINPKFSFKHSKIQSYILCFIAIKLSLVFYVVYFITLEDKLHPGYMYIAGYISIVGGFVYLFYSVYRGIQRAKNGHFRKNGQGLYNFKEEKGYVNVPIIYGATVMGGVIVRSLSDSGGTLSELFFLMLCLVVQYGIAMVWPEFLLLAYCRTKFDSFKHIPRKYK